MKKILVLIVALCGVFMIGCSDSKEPIEYRVSIYSLSNPVNDLIYENMIIPVNTEKLSNDEAIRIVEEVMNKDYLQRVTFCDEESKVIAKSSGKEDGSIHIEFEHEKESKSSRDIINITDKDYFNFSVEMAKKKLNNNK